MRYRARKWLSSKGKTLFCRGSYCEFESHQPRTSTLQGNVRKGERRVVECMVRWRGGCGDKVKG